MAWVPAVAGLVGGLMSNNSSQQAARGMQYRPWSGTMSGVGTVNYENGRVNMVGDERSQFLHSLLGQMGYGQLQQFQQGQSDMLGQDYLRGATGQADYSQNQNLLGLQGAVGQQTPYQGQDFMSGVNNGLLSNFDPQQAAGNYTNLLRQQAQPQEQNAAASALTNLYGTGRLGTTGGQTAYQGLMDSQNQADLGRQVAGQQFGLQQQLMAQQGYDQSRMNQQGLMMNQFGANQQGMMNQFGMDQGMFGRNLDLYTNSASATQDRFNRAMQLFGGENALNQQFMGNFQGLLGADQSQNQQLMDLGRLGASVGQSQNAANSNAAMYRNQGNQDMIAGFLGAINSSYNQPRAVK